MARQYLVLDDEPGDAGIFDAMNSVLLNLAGFGFVFKPHHDKELSDTLVEAIWLENDHKAMITLVDDFETPARYLILEAADVGTVAALTSVVREVVAVFDVEALRARARNDMSSEPAWLVRLALGTDEDFDAESFEVLRVGLDDSDPYVRYKAAWAAGLTHWEEFIGPLSKTEQNDTDKEVRVAARRAARACSRNKGRTS